MVPLTRRKPWLLALALLALVVVATLITQVILRSAEGRDLTFWQALLFVAETLSTTGYGEQLPFASPAAILWAILLMIVGIAVIFVGLATVASNWLSERFQPHPPRRAPRGLTGHVIICGAGPVGRFLAEEFAQADVPCILLSQDRPALQKAMESGLPALEGDPISAAGLQAAVLAEARALICTLGDPENASICLMARALRTDLPIFSTVEHSGNEPFLLAAGATRVLSAKRTLGERLGWLATAPLAGQLDRIWQQVEGLFFCQIPILPGSGLDHATLQAARVRERTGATVLGLWSHGHFHPATGATTPLRPGAVLIAAGRPDELDRLRALGQAQARPLSITNHEILILGSGDVGQAAAEVLRQQEIPYRTLSLNPVPGDPHMIHGDATDRDDLLQAGIGRVGRCIVAVDDDGRSVFATLMVRQLNPAIRIVARANSLEAVPRLYLAGADNVLSVSEVAGTQMVRLVLGEGALPPAIDELATREVPVPPGLQGRTLAEGKVAQRSGCLVLAVLDFTGTLQINPPADRRLQAGAQLLLFGTDVQFKRFERAYGAV